MRAEVLAQRQTLQELLGRRTRLADGHHALRQVPVHLLFAHRRTPIGVAQPANRSTPIAATPANRSRQYILGDIMSQSLPKARA